MDNWYGPIQVERIDNTPSAGEGFLPLDDTHLKFVHYPDCQQLITWLPRPGREYGNLRLLDKDSGSILEEWPVSDKLNGSIQVLWDTLQVKPGSYRIEIDWKDGFRHIIHFTKYKEGELPPMQATEEKAVPENKEPIIYKDGFGHVIEDEDLRLRENALKDIHAKFTRTLEYHSEGRSGTVIYVEADTRIPFYYELGGGDCVAWIDIPAPAQWEAYTKTPLSRRDDIVGFVAQRAKAQQAPGCNIKITDSSIAFMRK